MPNLLKSFFNPPPPPPGPLPSEIFFARDIAAAEAHEARQEARRLAEKEKKAAKKEAKKEKKYVPPFFPSISISDPFPPPPFHPQHRLSTLAKNVHELTRHQNRAAKAAKKSASTTDLLTTNSSLIHLTNLSTTNEQLSTNPSNPPNIPNPPNPSTATTTTTAPKVLAAAAEPKYQLTPLSTVLERSALDLIRLRALNRGSKTITLQLPPPAAGASSVQSQNQSQTVDFDSLEAKLSEFTAFYDEVSFCL